MITKQTIAVIGATGKMGVALVNGLATKDYRLLLIGRDERKLLQTTANIKTGKIEADIEAVTCHRDACWEADIIILSVPYTVEKEIANKIKEVAVGKIVVSITNPFENMTTTKELSAAEELQLVLPHSKVVKAFNTIPAESFQNPLLLKEKESFVAGNDAEAVALVADLVKTTGLMPVIVGDLTDSRNLESMASINQQQVALQESGNTVN